MDKYFNFAKNEFIIDNLESTNLVDRNEANQEMTGNLNIQGNLNVTNTLTANIMVTQGDISISDGLIEHIKIDGEEPVNDKNFGDYAEYRENSNDLFKGYGIGAGEDQLYVFTNSANRPLQDTDLSLLQKGTVSIREPVQPDECASKFYVDNHTSGNYLPLTGGTLSGLLRAEGGLNMNNNRIQGVGGPPIHPNEASNKAYTDAVGNTKLSLTGGNLTGNVKFPQGGKIQFQSTGATIDNIVGGNEFTVLRGGNDKYFAVNQLRCETNNTLDMNNNIIDDIKEVNLSDNNGRFVYFNDGTYIQTALANHNFHIAKHATTNKIFSVNTNTGATTLNGSQTINGNLIMPLNREILLGNNTLKTIGNNDIVFYKGDPVDGKFFALNNNEAYTTLNLRMPQAGKIRFITTGTAIDNIDGGILYTRIRGANGHTLVVNENWTEINNDVNMLGNNIINCESITSNGSLLTLSAGGAGAFRITNTLSDTTVPLRMNGNKITLLGTPTADSDAATKLYVDNAVNGGGDVHLPKYHKVYFAPTPDSGQTYKTYTNDGFGQVVFEMSSPILSTTSGYALWNINMPPLNFMDELVTFIIKIKEDNTVVETIECGGTYNGFVGTGYLTMPNLTKGCHEFQTASPTTILGLELICKPRGAMNSTARLNLDSNSGMDKIYRVFDVELININT